MGSNCAIREEIWTMNELNLDVIIMYSSNIQMLHLDIFLYNFPSFSFFLNFLCTNYVSFQSGVLSGFCSI